VPFGCRPSPLGRPIPAAGLARSCDEVTGVCPRPQRGSHVPHRQAVSGELASLHREPGTVSAGPLIPADRCSCKDVSATCVPLIITMLPPRLHSRSTRLRLFLASISAVAAYCLFAFTACLRPRGYPLRPGRMETGVRCSPGLVSVPSDPDT
jgi:hypothetical protein